MSYWEIAVLAIVLAVDAFSVAAAVAPSCCRRWGPLRLAGAFGLFQAGMPLLGALAGTWLLQYIGDYDRWVAFGLLEIIGMKILVDAFLESRGEKQRRETCPVDPSFSLALLGLAVATSIDAFGAGIALATRDASLWIAAPTIGLVCALLTLLGARLGSTAEKYLGSKAAVAGSLVLMALGVRMLF